MDNEPLYHLIHWNSAGGWVAHRVIRFDESDRDPERQRVIAVHVFDSRGTTDYHERGRLNSVPDALSMFEHEFHTAPWHVVLALQMRGDLAAIAEVAHG